MPFFYKNKDTGKNVVTNGADITEFDVIIVEALLLVPIGIINGIVLGFVYPNLIEHVFPFTISHSRDNIISAFLPQDDPLFVFEVHGHGNVVFSLITCPFVQLDPYPYFII